MHEVTITKKKPLSIEYCIDNCTVELFKHLAKVDLQDTKLIQKIICDIEVSLTEIKPLTPFVALINGKNLFRILDKLFYNVAIDNWKRFYEEYTCTKELAFHKAFEYYFGFYPSKRTPFTRLYEDIRTLSVSFNQQKRAKQPNIAASENRQVQFLETINNVAYFRINNHIVISICLSGRPELRDSSRVLALTSEIGKALANEDYSSVRETIAFCGAKTFLQISRYYFHQELCHFLTNYAKNTVISKRTPLKPRIIMKHFFGTQTSRYYLALLGMLEKLIVWANDYLVSSSVQELESNKRTWVLCEPKGTGISLDTVSFSGSDTLVSEVQAYCRKEATIYRNAGKPYSHHIYNIARCINSAVDALSERELMIDSVLDLTAFHVRTIAWILSVEKEYATNTQRYMLFTLRALFEFVASKAGVNKTSPFPPDVFPIRQVKPTQPISSEDLYELAKALSEEPEYIQLAFALTVATGARANSICELTVDDFSLEKGKWIVTITHLKTLTAKKVPTARPELDLILADRIQNYIMKTEDLRQDLPKPYLFVYQHHQNREESARMPMILSASKFRNAIARVFPKFPLYDAEGNPIICAFKTLRATFGKELYLAGVSAEEAALRMGNTAPIKELHYTTLSSTEMADLRHEQYNKTLLPILATSTPIIPILQGSPVMFGSCENNKVCNSNNCTTCNHLITCKENGQKRGDVNAQ